MAKIEIDLLDTSLDNSGDGDHEIMGLVDEGSFGSGGDDKSHIPAQRFLDSGEEDGTYNYRTQNSGTVTYRLVHVGADEGGGGEMPSSGGTSVYHSHSPASLLPDVGSGAPVQTVLASPLNGQFYVIGNSSEVFGSAGPKTIIPRETHSRVTNVVKKRDDRRRATHNEVERRRRDKINNWIVKLSKIIPPSQDGGDKAGLEGQSKGGILSKACEYITDLKDSHQRLSETIRDNDRLASELMKLNQQLSVVKRENTALRNQLSHHGILLHSEQSEGS